jgi:tetratricopeptide (TPR) repeat protein
MKTLFTLLFCGVLVNSGRVFATNIDLVELRRLYYKASGNKEYCGQFYKKVINVDDGSLPVLLCYKGMGLFLRCRHHTNPYYKLQDFNEGKKLIEKAVKLDPENVEIRFLRFCIQSQAPRMLRYYGSVAEDKSLIINSWKSVSDKDLKEKIRAYMLEHGNFSEREKTYLQ